MGTRSIVAARTESGIKGVYVHWDGYPEGRLPVLRAMIERDGVSKVVRTIIGKPNGWSHLSNEMGDELESMHSDGRFIAVPGYGVQYADYPIQGDQNYWEPKDHTESEVFIEYIYIINEDGSVDWADACGKDFRALRWFTDGVKV